jgi:hypothetical protein
MPVYMVGSGGAQSPFNRTFFNVTLGDLLQRAGREKSQKLLLFLADGTTLDVCSIDDLADDYIAVRSYHANEEACELSVNLIPYSLIYRIEMSPKDAESSARVGFHWTPPAKRGTAIRKPAK